MTNEEAIKSLKNIIEYWTYQPTEVESATLAIEALEENDKLKAEIERIKNESHRRSKMLLQEIEQLEAELEQSMKLPCKVGDVIYTKKLVKLYVIGIHIAEDICIKASTDVSNSIWTGREFKMEDFGKIVFTTREEAEQSLKGKV